MPVNCNYHPGRILEIEYHDYQDGISICTLERYNIVLIERGTLRYTVNGSAFSSTGPCVMAFREGLDVRICDADRLVAYGIAFNVSFLNVNITFEMINSGKYHEICEMFSFIPLDIFYDRNGFLGSISVSGDAAAQMREHYIKFRDAITLQKDFRWSCRARLHLNSILELLNQLYFDLLAGGTPKYEIAQQDVWVDLILKKIHADYSGKISLITLAEDIHINKTTVSKCFKEATGFSVTDYIINYRIKCACYSLATTKLTVREIAEECGFQSSGYFIRQFRARMGMTPTQYREKCIQERRVGLAKQ